MAHFARSRRITAAPPVRSLHAQATGPSTVGIARTPKPLQVTGSLSEPPGGYRRSDDRARSRGARCTPQNGCAVISRETKFFPQKPRLFRETHASINLPRVGDLLNQPYDNGGRPRSIETCAPWRAKG